MKTLVKDELYQNLTGFLKTKGIILADGSYARAVQKSCSLLSDAINCSQESLERAKVEVDRKLDQMRQCIHEKTAPKPPRTGQASPPPPPTNAAPPQAEPTAAAAGASAQPKATKAAPRRKTAAKTKGAKKPGKSTK